MTNLRYPLGQLQLNSLTQNFNRRVLDKAFSQKNPISIIFAIPDHPWVDSTEGAAVRISMSVARKGNFSDQLLVSIQKEDSKSEELNLVFQSKIGHITTSLSIGAELGKAKPLLSNSKISGMGSALHGAGFILSSETAKDYSKQGSNIIRAYIGGRDLLQTRRERYVINFSGLSESQAKQINPIAFQHVIDHVKPERDQNSRKNIREIWWRFGWERPLLRKALEGVSRYIATTETSKHRVFQVTVPRGNEDWSLQRFFSMVNATIFKIRAL